MGRESDGELSGFPSGIPWRVFMNHENRLLDHDAFDFVSENAARQNTLIAPLG